MKQEAIKPIRVMSGEGKDELEEGDYEGERDPLQVLDIRTFRSSIDRNGGAEGISDPLLYRDDEGNGLDPDQPEAILVVASVNEALRRANQYLAKVKMQVGVSRGFVSPSVQQRRWRAQYVMELVRGTRMATNVDNQLASGKIADNVGSIAEVDIENSPGYKGAFDQLSCQYPTLNSGRVKELIRIRANMGELEGVKVATKLAMTVHNLGRSVNVYPFNLTDFGLLSDGVGLDTNVPVLQEVDAFEANSRFVANLMVGNVTGNNELRRYLQCFAMSNEDIEEFDVEDWVTVVDDIRYIRRRVFAAMTKAGFGYYRGEQGHFSMPLRGPVHRDEIYEEARKLGYKNIA